MTDTPIRFLPGTIVATVGALQVADQSQIAALLARHLSGDWGDLGDADKQANEDALTHGDRLVSKYELTPGTALYVITEWNRSQTTVLTPGEY
jgi:hypothetical protein